jgi:hypothetical protein
MFALAPVRVRVAGSVCATSLARLRGELAPAVDVAIVCVAEGMPTHSVDVAVIVLVICLIEVIEVFGFLVALEGAGVGTITGDAVADHGAFVKGMSGVFSLIPTRMLLDMARAMYLP